jgi:hypothetical protein
MAWEVVRHTYQFTMPKEQYNQWEVSLLFQPPLDVLTPRYGQIYKILCGKATKKTNYEITLGNSPTCTCMDFVIMISSSLGTWGKWLPCKHMYYVLQDVMFCG